MQSKPSLPTLQIDAREAFIPVANSFAENTSMALGLGRPEALDLALAVEEVFNHPCRVVLPEGGLVTIQCSAGGYFVRVDFTFPAAVFDLHTFNITTKVSLADDAGIEQMGLMLASRSVDRFKVVGEPGRGLIPVKDEKLRFCRSGFRPRPAHLAGRRDREGGDGVGKCRPNRPHLPRSREAPDRGKALVETPSRRYRPSPESSSPHKRRPRRRRLSPVRFGKPAPPADGSETRARPWRPDLKRGHSSP
jgi:hypothetical protein